MRGTQQGDMGNETNPLHCAPLSHNHFSTHPLQKERGSGRETAPSKRQAINA